jgi:hypothetical protein
MQPWIPNEFGRPAAVSAGNARSAGHRTSEPRCATNNNNQHNNKVMKITSLLQNTNLKAGRPVCCVPTDALNLLWTQDGARGATRPTSLRRLAGRLSLLALSGLLLVGRAEAIEVTTTNDAGLGSLRDAISNAPAGGTITFAAALAGQAITLTNGQLAVNKDLTINGPGARVLTVQRSTADDAPDFRIFKIEAGTTVNISGLTIANGRLSSLDLEREVSSGGGILNQGTLTLDGVTVTANFANFGGGVANLRGTVNLRNSTVSHNMVANKGGGFYNYGTDGTAILTLTNSTVSVNGAFVGEGGAILNEVEVFRSGSAQLSLVNCTVSANTADSGGGIFNSCDFNLQAKVTLSSTIVAHNNADSGPDIGQTIKDAAVSGTYSLVEQAGFVFSSGSNNIIGLDPMLGPLADNCGPTDTHALLLGSPAIDAAPCSGVTNDQRGVVRPQGPACDIGAFEVQADTTPPSLVCPSNQTVNATGPSGAVTNYSATASDTCGTVVVTYTNAIAGTPITGPYPFPIGDTTVNVTATDAAGNVTTCSFVVHVEGAAEQINDLIGKVQGLPNVKSPNKTALKSPLQTALAALAANNKPNTCLAMQAFINLVKAQKDKKLISATAAADLIAEATRIKAVLGCP